MKTQDIQVGQQYLLVESRDWYLRSHARNFQRLTVTEVGAGRYKGFYQWVEADKKTGVLKTSKIGKSYISGPVAHVNRPWDEFVALYTDQHERKYAAHREALAARKRIEELVGGKKAAKKTVLDYRFEPKIHNDGSVSSGRDEIDISQLLELLEMAREEGRQSVIAEGV